MWVPDVLNKILDKVEYSSAHKRQTSYTYLYCIFSMHLLAENTKAEDVVQDWRLAILKVRSSLFLAGVGSGPEVLRETEPTEPIKARVPGWVCMLAPAFPNCHGDSQEH